MKLLKKIALHEVLRRWAINEVSVDRLDAFAEASSSLDNINTLLRSGIRESEEQGISQILKSHHQSLVDCFPADAEWYLAELSINRQNFDALKTLPVQDLAKISNNTYRVCYAANIVADNPSLNPRIFNLMNAFKTSKEQIQLSGITLLSKKMEGPYTIIEGNGRLISLYHLYFSEKLSVITNDCLEVVIGIADKGIED